MQPIFNLQRNFEHRLWIGDYPFAPNSNLFLIHKNTLVCPIVTNFQEIIVLLAEVYQVIIKDMLGQHHMFLGHLRVSLICPGNGAKVFNLNEASVLINTDGPCLGNIFF
jgi:hypothetical protein